MPTAERTWNKAIKNMVQQFFELYVTDYDKFLDCFDERSEDMTAYKQLAVRDLMRGLEYHFIPDPDEPDEFNEEETKMWKSIWNPITRLRNKQQQENPNLMNSLYDKEIYAFINQFEKQLLHRPTMYMVVAKHTRKVYWRFDPDSEWVYKKLIGTNNARQRLQIEELKAHNIHLHQNYHNIRTTCEELVKQVEGLRNKRAIPPHIKQIVYDTKSKDDEFKCCICLDKPSLEDYTLSSCGHDYCKECIDKISNCSICRAKI